MLLQDHLSFIIDITLVELKFKITIERSNYNSYISDHVKAFKCNLHLWKIQIQNENLTHFFTCVACKTNKNEPVCYKKYLEKITSIYLKTELKLGFKILNIYIKGF